MISTYDLAKYKKFAVGGGCASLLAATVFEYYRLKRTLNKLIAVDVLDIDKKRPDYIYIKYSIYRESMARLRHKQAIDKQWINVFIQPLGKWWKSVKHSVAWRLLEVAKTGDRHDRLKAVYQLAQIDHLKCWDYQHLAQVCDARTAVSLARHQCDNRWFLQPRCKGAVRHPKSLITEIRDQMELLRSQCRCVDHFYKAAFNKFGILKGYLDDKTLQPFGRCRITKNEFECLRQCLEVMAHMTRDVAVGRTLIEVGFLQTLVEIQKLFYYNNEMRFLLSKVLSNLSMCNDVTEDFFVTGWIGLLAEWSKSPDLRVQVTSAKSLANMDLEDNSGCVYQPNVYPLYPKTRSKRPHDVDIVFVHGLLGGVFVTWRQKDREEPTLGLYGKNAFYYTKDGEDDIFMIEEFNKSAPKSARRPRVPKVDSSNGSGVVRKTATVQELSNPSKSDMLVYNESPLINTTSNRKSKLLLSDINTKELIATLQTADELTPDWEIVYPDCPTFAEEKSKGPFSISGEEWTNEASDEEYTYCWPMDWLPDDQPTVRVFGVHYDTALSEWSTNSHRTCPCEKKGTIHNRSADLLNSLIAAGVGSDNRPIIWIGHSMGGLIAKSVIVQAIESTDPNVRRLAENTGGILFMGTPHRGSSIAKMKQHVQMLVSPTIEVMELVENGNALLTLHEKFVQFMDARPRIRIVSVAEGLPMVLSTLKLPFYIVTADSAKLPYGDFYVLNMDHLGLSKPFCRQSFLYQRILAMLFEVRQAEDRTKASATNKPEIDVHFLAGIDDL